MFISIYIIQELLKRGKNRFGFISPKKTSELFFVVVFFFLPRMLLSFFFPPFFCNLPGSLSDTYGNYNAAFYLAGISFALSGISCIPLRRISRWENERAERKKARETAAQAPVEIKVESAETLDLQTIDSSVDESKS